MQTNCILKGLSAALGMLLYSSSALYAAEGPYFVTYTHQLEEQGNLDIENRSVLGRPAGGDRFIGSAIEFEYGLLGWWTTEFYLDGQARANDSVIFTGFRWENRFRLTRREHWINPVFYLEFENTNGADKALLEVVGHDGEADLLEPNATARQEKEREIESKLILGSNWRGWNISENFIVEKNVAHEPWEFGYAVGVYRPLALEARPDTCSFCRENFRVGAEAYGGLGDTKELTLRNTSHYLAPTLEWALASGLTFKVSPGFGLSETSTAFLLRFGISYEVSQFARRFHPR
jgi:hypothetical protein